MSSVLTANIIPSLGEAKPGPVGQLKTQKPSVRSEGTIKRGLSWKNLTATGEGEMARNRLVISLIILVYFLVESTINGRYLALPIFTITSFFVFSLAISLHNLVSPEPNHLRRLIAIFADIGTLSVGLYIGEEVTACTWPVYLWVIYGNGFRFGQTYLAVSTTFATVCFLAVVMATPFWSEFYNLSIGLIAGLIILPVYARKLINDLSIARQRAEDANKTKSLFLASVSHELRTPLNAIVGLSECLTSTRLDAEQNEMMTTIYRSGRTLSHLIENILDFSRLESGAMPCNVKDVHLPTLIQDIHGLARAQALSKNISFNIHLHPEVPTRIDTDAMKLNQILTNFISNALKFTDEGHVTLSISCSNNSLGPRLLRFEVVDTGIGISKDAQTKIFERFTQENEKIVDRYGGTGLGLAIVQQTATLIGGTVGVESTQGEGSTFWCEIPLSNNITQPDEARTPSANIAFFVGETTTQALEQSALPMPDNKFLKDHDALLSDCMLAHRAGKNTILFTDAETQDVVSDWIANRGDHLAVVVRIIGTDASEIDKKTIEQTSVAQIELDRFAEDVPHLLNWIEDIESKNKNSENTLSASVEPASVLIAEDNPANQLVIRKIMSNAGHKFTIVNDGEGVMTALVNDSYDVILLDLNMPVMNGFETIQFIRFALHEQDVPVIAVTADATAETAERCHEAGFDAVVTKPYRAQTLLDVIDEHAGGKIYASADRHHDNWDDDLPLENIDDGLLSSGG